MDWLGVRQLPFFTRRNYHYEVLHLLPWGLLAGMVEGNISAVVAAETFDGSRLLITVTSTTPVAAFLASLLWGMLCVGRRKLQVFTVACCGVLLFAATVGLTPQNQWGGWCFAVQMACAQFCMTGVVTTRSALWKSNYPAAARGRITARLQALRAILSMIVLVAVSCLFDYDNSAYRYAYPLAAVLGMFGVFIVQRVHVRGERNELRRISTSAEEELNPGWVEPFSLTTLLSPGRVLERGLRVLREDRRFRKYLSAQFLGGVANLMVRTVVVAILADELLPGIGRFYSISIVLLDVLPRLLMFGSLGRWGRLFDRIGVVRFRIVNAIGWTLSLAVGGLATFLVVSTERFGPIVIPLAMGGFALRAILQGATFGGGIVAWHIGHLHFAKPEEAEVYMGIHVSLTGLRGLIMPGLGILLYGWIGWWVWMVAVAISLLALGGYISLARDEARDHKGAAPQSVPRP
ncbi:MAG: hypothetical protein KAV82_01900 [Phycisphaerae bacterium]|nr:hypothetical protein [Phycisphaerae bacterium]